MSSYEGTPEDFDIDEGKGMPEIPLRNIGSSFINAFTGHRDLPPGARIKHERPFEKRRRELPHSESGEHENDEPFLERQVIIPNQWVKDEAGNLAIRDIGVAFNENNARLIDDRQSGAWTISRTTIGDVIPGTYRRKLDVKPYDVIRNGLEEDFMQMRDSGFPFSYIPENPDSEEGVIVENNNPARPEDTYRILRPKNTVVRMYPGSKSKYNHIELKEDGETTIVFEHGGQPTLNNLVLGGKYRIERDMVPPSNIRTQLEAILERAEAEGVPEEPPVTDEAIHEWLAGSSE